MSVAPGQSVHAIAEEDLEDYILANAPEYVDSMREAEEELARGKTRRGEDVFSDLGL